MSCADGSGPDEGAGNGADVPIGPEPACGNDPEVTGGAAGNGADVPIGPEPVCGNDPEASGGGAAGNGAETSGKGCEIEFETGCDNGAEVCCGADSAAALGIDGKVPSPSDCEIGPDGGGGKGAEV